MVIFELSFQFPMKRVGASPVAASVAAAGSDATGEADAVSVAIGDSLAVGVAAGVSEFFLELEITIAPRRTTPTRTSKSTLLDEPCLGAADGLVADFAGAGRAEAKGVVDTLTRALPVAGTAGITTFDEGDFFTAFLAVAFFTIFLAVDFLAGAFLATFFAVVFFFAAVFFTAVFFAGDFLAAFLAVDFFGAAFFAALFFFTATVYLLELKKRWDMGEV